VNLTIKAVSSFEERPLPPGHEDWGAGVCCKRCHVAFLPEGEEGGWLLAMGRFLDAHQQCDSLYGVVQDPKDGALVKMGKIRMEH